jgi:hypothetical protein
VTDRGSPFPRSRTSDEETQCATVLQQPFAEPVLIKETWQRIWDRYEQTTAPFDLGLGRHRRKLSCDPPGAQCTSARASRISLQRSKRHAKSFSSDGATHLHADARSRSV